MSHHRPVGAVAWLLTGLVAVLWVLAFGVAQNGVTASAAEDDGFALVLDHGHMDAFALVKEQGRLTVRLQEDVTGHHVLHDADDVLLKVKEAARMTLPSPVPAGLSFLGTGGEDIYLLPQTQDPDLIWPGWSTERLAAADFTNPLRIHVDAVAGPGKVFVWQDGSFGDPKPVLTSGDYQLPGSIAVNVNAHVHANWAFTAAGRYKLTVHAEGTPPGGGVMSSDPVVYTFNVGEVGTTPDPTADPTPSPTSDPTPTPDPSPTPDPDPEPGVVWDVPNATVNKQGATVLNNGHVDVASVLDGSVLNTRVKDTTTSSTPSWRRPERTVLQLLPSSKSRVPANPSYSFLGSAGSPFYQVTQSQQAGLLWPGWSTEAIDVTATTGGVLWALTDTSGPGEFAIYETGSFGQPTVLFNTRDGITPADRFTIPKNTHAHGSWAFSEQGNYCLSMQRVAQQPSGKMVSDQFVLAVAVGKADVMNLDPSRCGQQVDTDPPVIEPPPPDDDDGSGGLPDGDKPSQQDQTRCTATAPSRATILSAGHVDYAARIIGGELQAQVGDDTSGAKVYRDPSDTILWLKPAAKVTLPTGYGQVGGPGTVVWQVPQTQNPSLIWLGWNTELLNSGNARGPVTWRLDKVDGPGTVKVYLSGAFGGVQTMVLSGAGSSYSIDLGVHAHANWAFSKEGIYRLTMTQSVILANGKRSSDTEVLTIVVGDVEPASAAREEAGCRVVTTTSGTTGGTDRTAVAAPQAAAPSAAGVSPGTTGGESAEEAAADDRRGDDPVPLLLGTLGGLLLLGAGGTGLLWWRSVIPMGAGSAGTGRVPAAS